LSGLEGPEKLAYMANQIARYFAAQPGEGAAQAACDHLKSFWTPAMRRTITAHKGSVALSEVAAAAVALLPEAADKGAA